MTTKGNVVYRHGGLDAHGEILEESIQFGAIAADREGRATYKPWEMDGFLWKRTIPPKGFTSDQVLARLPANLSGRITVAAQLRYRSVAPHIVQEILPQQPFDPKIIEMARHKVTIAVP